jgi:hypothetical protein
MLRAGSKEALMEGERPDSNRSEAWMPSGVAGSNPDAGRRVSDRIRSGDAKATPAGPVSTLSGYECEVSSDYCKLGIQLSEIAPELDAEKRLRVSLTLLAFQRHAGARSLEG